MFTKKDIYGALDIHCVIFSSSGLAEQGTKHFQPSVYVGDIFTNSRVQVRTLRDIARHQSISLSLKASSSRNFESVLVLWNNIVS